MNEGKGWTEATGTFERLPASAQPKIHATAWMPATHSAGICIRFTTDAATVNFRWSLTSANSDMPHMPAIGVSGLDLYARTADASWRIVGNGRPTIKRETSTNIASALLTDPEIKDKPTVHGMGYRHQDRKLKTNESNRSGDLNAATFLPNSGVEMYVMSSTTLRHFQWEKALVDSHFKDRDGIRDHLVQRWDTYATNDKERTLLDIAVFEAFLRPALATVR